MFNTCYDSLSFVYVFWDSSFLFTIRDSNSSMYVLKLSHFLSVFSFNFSTGRGSYPITFLLYPRLWGGEARFLIDSEILN